MLQFAMSAFCEFSRVHHAAPVGSPSRVGDAQPFRCEPGDIPLSPPMDILISAMLPLRIPTCIVHHGEKGNKLVTKVSM